jgi:hypothetical protein
MRRYIGALIILVVLAFPVVMAFWSCNLSGRSICSGRSLQYVPVVLYVPVVPYVWSFWISSGRYGHCKENKFKKEKLTEQFAMYCLL